MVKYVPPSFDSARVITGLHQAMGFGEPNATADKATFFFPKQEVVADPSDEDGVPFDPSVRPADDSATPVTVPCAVEFFDASGASTHVGQIDASRVKITLLDAEWQLVKEFTFMTVGGEKYMRDKIEPPVALGSIDVWTAWAVSEDER